MRLVGLGLSVPRVHSGCDVKIFLFRPCRVGFSCAILKKNLLNLPVSVGSVVNSGGILEFERLRVVWLMGVFLLASACFVI